MADQNSTQDFIRLTHYHLALIAGGFTVVGVLIGALINHYCSNWRNRKDRFLSAYDAFRQAFLPAIQDLEQNLALSAARIILLEYRKHSYALKIFSPSVAKSQIHRLNEKWNEYKDHYETYYSLFCRTLDRYDGLSIIDFVCKNRTEDDQINRGKILHLLNDILKITGEYK